MVGKLLLSGIGFSFVVIRYIDDIYLISNESLETINQMLDQANNYHKNIELTRVIGTSVYFLDLFIENKNSVLGTSVYHKL